MPSCAVLPPSSSYRPSSRPRPRPQVIRRRLVSDDDASSAADTPGPARLRRAVDSFVSTLSHGLADLDLHLPDSLTPLRGAATAAIARVASGLLMAPPDDEADAWAGGYEAGGGGSPGAPGGRRSSLDVTLGLIGALRRGGSRGGSPRAAGGLLRGSGGGGAFGGGAFAGGGFEQRHRRSGSGAGGGAGGGRAVAGDAAAAARSRFGRAAPPPAAPAVPLPALGVPFVWPRGAPPPPAPAPPPLGSYDEAEVGPPARGGGGGPGGAAPDPRPAFLDMVPWYSGGRGAAGGRAGAAAVARGSLRGSRGGAWGGGSPAGAGHPRGPNHRSIAHPCPPLPTPAHPCLPTLPANAQAPARTCSRPCLTSWCRSNSSSAASTCARCRWGLAFAGFGVGVLGAGWQEAAGARRRHGPAAKLAPGRRPLPPPPRPPRPPPRLRWRIPSTTRPPRGTASPTNTTRSGR
jgi:hypothetical protein